MKMKRFFGYGEQFRSRLPKSDMSQATSEVHECSDVYVSAIMFEYVGCG